mmetsp:Transcript_11068/g.27220  ORF Transcript_11068/g.27220 Transcript_11068/m.27220 type:complete len:152 (-) Transcript_11068:761-1216(-)
MNNMNMKLSLLMLGILSLHLGTSSAFALSSSHRQQSLATSKSTSTNIISHHTSSDLMHRHATPSADNDDESTVGGDDDKATDSSPFAKINSFLDTPILDANNKSDQGAVAEALKDFVRDEPQVAQIAFSGAAVLFFFVGVRIVNAIKYGSF